MGFLATFILSFSFSLVTMFFIVAKKKLNLNLNKISNFSSDANFTETIKGSYFARAKYEWAVVSGMRSLILYIRILASTTQDKGTKTKIG